MEQEVEATWLEQKENGEGTKERDTESRGGAEAGGDRRRGIGAGGMVSARAIDEEIKSRGEEGLCIFIYRFFFFFIYNVF